MSVCGGQKRYVSTLRIQLSAPTSGRASHNICAQRKSREGATNSETSFTTTVNDRTHSCSSSPRNAGLENGDLKSPKTNLEDISVFRGTNSSQSPQIPNSPREFGVKRRSSSETVVPLKIASSPVQVEVQAGETVRLSCNIKGNAPIVSCWIYDKKEVLEGSRFRIESSTLVISDARPEDAGRYTLVVRDRNSSAQHSVTLSVIARPQPPASSPLVCVLSSHSVTLSWSGPCYDGGAVITGYVVEVQQVHSTSAGRWTELSSSCKSTSLTVNSGLQLQAQYRFRVRACNAVGPSDPSPESQVIRMDSSAGEPHDEKRNDYVIVTIDEEHKVTDHYNILDKLGVGKFGQVYRLSHKQSGQQFAGKFYKGRRVKERDAAKKEIKLMNLLHHPRLVQCVAAYDNKLEIVMVMELIAGGELFERIVDDKFEHTEQSCISYMRQILQGVQFIHTQNIVHLDLKPENIMCENTTGFQIKIIDFGLASKLDPAVPLRVMQGTPEFVAPEVINYEPVGLSADMWSIGVICYILLSGESPFQGESDSETLALVTAAKWEFDEESFVDVTTQAKGFISSLLQKNVRNRMSCNEALSHRWMETVESFEAGAAKNLSKDKMKKFLAKQKWKKTGKAVLALKRMALLSKSDTSTALSSPEDDTQHVLKSLEERMQSNPAFIMTPSDLSVVEDSTAQLVCHVTGYPDPEVLWLRDGEVLDEQDSSVQVDYAEDGLCVLTLNHVTPHHRGRYTCKATNVHGEALCSAKITVVLKD